MADLRLLATLVVAQQQMLLNFLNVRRKLFEDCPDYEVRGLVIPESDKPWVVVAEDKRTGRPLWEYCVDHEDAKTRRALLRQHGHRFTKLEIVQPRVLKDLRAQLSNLGRPGSGNDRAQAWPFPAE